jgi:hypothetical protein
MSQADSAEYWTDELVKVLNKLRKLNTDVTYLTALDDVADQMGLTVEKVYKR